MQISTVPLYKQVRDLLALQIYDRKWKYGASLPNEVDLAKELGVSAGTVRKALDLLEAEHLVARRQGRGTFVLDQTSQKLASRFSNIRSEVGGHRIEGETQLLEQSRAPANELEGGWLELSPGVDVIRTRRVCTNDGRRFMYEEAVLPVAEFAGLSEENVGNYQLSGLAQAHGVQLGKARESVIVQEATRFIARNLGIEPKTAVLRLDRVVRSIAGRPVEWRIGFCHLANGEVYVAELV